MVPVRLSAFNEIGPVQVQLTPIGSKQEYDDVSCVLSVVESTEGKLIIVVIITVTHKIARVEHHRGLRHKKVAIERTYCCCSPWYISGVVDCCHCCASGCDETTELRANDGCVEAWRGKPGAIARSFDEPARPRRGRAMREIYWLEENRCHKRKKETASKVQLILYKHT
jgi:hypothetical protein